MHTQVILEFRSFPLLFYTIDRIVEYPELEGTHTDQISSRKKAEPQLRLAWNISLSSSSCTQALKPLKMVPISALNCGFRKCCITSWLPCPNSGASCSSRAVLEQGGSLGKGGDGIQHTGMQDALRPEKIPHELSGTQIKKKSRWRAVPLWFWPLAKLQRNYCFRGRAGSSSLPCLENKTLFFGMDVLMGGD